MHNCMYNSTCGLPGSILQCLMALDEKSSPRMGGLNMRQHNNTDSTFYIFNRRALCYDTSSSSLHLQLPYKYRLLEDKFRCTNVALSMLEKRKETCTFSKVRKAVQEMTRK